MSFNLRKRSRLNYYEPDEPSFDEYLYCDQCSDFVYDYCAIHGPLLVIPDDKVPAKTNLPAFVPRAALTIPNVFLHLAPSIIPGAGVGVFSTLTLPRGVRFGPYCGQRTQNADSMYCWQIYDNNRKRSHVLDAVDGDRSNWMRYVNCARHWKEQNLLAYQYQGQLYYRTIKIIPRFTELMVFYGSEFANALHINLCKYNCAAYYGEIIRTSNNVRNETKDSNDIQDEYLTEDQFHFIDEDLSQKKNIQISTNLIEQSIEMDSCKEILRIQNINSKSQTEKTKFKCEICEKTFNLSKYLKEHTLRHLNIYKYNCEYCPYKSNYNYRYKQHLGKHTNTFKFICENCNFRTNYFRNFREHCFRHVQIRKLENNKSFSGSYFSMEKTCEICNFKTFSRKCFGTHMSKHKGDIYKCAMCSYCSHSKYNLSKHISRKH